MEMKCETIRPIGFCVWEFAAVSYLIAMQM